MTGYASQTLITDSEAQKKPPNIQKYKLQQKTKQKKNNLIINY